MKIGEVAEAAGVSVDTVRYYERRGVIPRPARTDSGYRTFGPTTIERIRLARRLQTLGLTLDEVTAALHIHDRGESSCADERWRLEVVLDRIDARVDMLLATRREVEAVLASCDRGACIFG